MKTSPLDLYKRQTNSNRKNQPHQENKNKNQINNATLQGVLLNNYIKKRENQTDLSNFDKISSSLLIPEQQIQQQIQTKKEEKENSFDYKKVLKPIAITTGATLASIAAISLCMKNYSKVMATKNDIVRPGDLARNFNILEEPHYAMYRALRDPNAKNILGLIGVGMFSALTLTAKNFTDGTKEIWIKKQTSDIERDLQENLIQVETDAFSGKLNVVNTLLKDTTEYFKGIFSSNQAPQTNFKNFLSFKGDNEDNNEEKKNKNIKTILLASGGVLGILGLSFALFKNFQKTVKNLDTFVQKFEDKEIKSKIANALQCDDKEKAIKQLTDILKVINAKDETMQTNLSQIKGITPEEIACAIKDIKSAQIYAQAPEALGGVAEKIQYYCYINEERGHLYNWILNPENKFNKYLFLCFSAISAVGYVAKETADAIKEITVSKENSKTELNLRKRLVEVEIENFKSKKLSAINPLIDNFIYQLEKGKPKEELKELAENILIEIKNGPPYVYS